MIGASSGERGSNSGTLLYSLPKLPRPPGKLGAAAGASIGEPESVVTNYIYKQLDWINFTIRDYTDLNTEGPRSLEPGGGYWRRLVEAEDTRGCHSPQV